MTLDQIKDYCEEMHGNQEVLDEIVEEMIYDKGWSLSTSLKDIMVTHSVELEKRIKNFNKIKY